MKKNVQKTKEKVTKALNQAKSQAKESLKALGTLEKETLAKAKKTLDDGGAKIHELSNQVIAQLAGLNIADRKKLTNDKILASLKKMGVATQSDIEALNARISSLEAQLAGAASAGAGKKTSASTTDSAIQ